MLTQCLVVSAAQAWNRNDARAAKALSLRGQSENDMMRKAHREAARELYEDRNRRLPSSRTSNDGGDDDTESLPEIYCDLHGLHPDEAVEYLERVLLENAAETRPVYAITGTGGGSHHSGANGGAAGSGTNGSGGGRSGKDKVGRAVRAFLNEWRYAYREFSVPGDRSGSGGILGIDARSYDRGLAQREGGVAIGGNSSNSNRGGSGGGGSGKSAASSANTSGAAADGASTAAGKESEKQQQPATTAESLLDQGREIGDGKVKLLVRGGGPSSSSGTATTAGNEPPKGPSAGRR